LIKINSRNMDTIITWELSMLNNLTMQPQHRQLSHSQKLTWVLFL